MFSVRNGFQIHLSTQHLSLTNPNPYSPIYSGIEPLKNLDKSLFINKNCLLLNNFFVFEKGKYIYK